MGQREGNKKELRPRLSFPSKICPTSHRRGRMDFGKISNKKQFVRASLVTRLKGQLKSPEHVLNEFVNIDQTQVSDSLAYH